MEFLTPAETMTLIVLLRLEQQRRLDLYRSLDDDLNTGKISKDTHALAFDVYTTGEQDLTTIRKKLETHYALSEDAGAVPDADLRAPAHGDRRSE